MKKLISVLLCISMFLLLICGCSVSKDIETSGPKEQLSDNTMDPVEDENQEAMDYSSAKVVPVYTGTTYLTEWSDDYEGYICQTLYGSVTLADTAKEQYTGLNDALQDLSMSVKESSESEFQSNLNDARSNYEDYPDMFTPYASEQQFYVQRADECVVSLLSDVYMYTGGAHGFYGNTSYNYDTMTGKELLLEDVITDQSKLRELIKKLVLENYADLDLYDLDDAIINAKDNTFEWILGYKGMEVVFNPYTIAPYAAGIQRVLIPYKGNEDLFQRDFSSQVTSYGISFKNNLPFYYDIDEDGAIDEITLRYSNDEYDMITEQVVCINGKEFINEVECYELMPTLIHLADNTEYLLLEELLDNDYRLIDVYELSDKSVSKVDSVMAGTYGIQYENDTYYDMPILDPTGFNLSVHTDMLSTVSGIGKFCIQQGGKIKELSENYQLSSEMELTVLQEVTGECIGEDDEANGQTVTIPKGEKVMYFRTDNRSYCDLRTEEGEIIRVKLDKTDYPARIDGVDIYELFDGMIFAG